MQFWEHHFIRPQQRCTDKVGSQKTLEFVLNFSHAFDESVTLANLVRFDIGKFNIEKSLFCSNYVHAVSNWPLNIAPVNVLKEACLSYHHLHYIHFPKLTKNKIQILLGVNATQLERVPSRTLRKPLCFSNLLGRRITGPIRQKMRQSYRNQSSYPRVIQPLIMHSQT